MNAASAHKGQRRRGQTHGLARCEEVVGLSGLLGVRQQGVAGTAGLEAGQPSQWFSLGALGLIWPEFPVAHKKPEISRVVLFDQELSTHREVRWNILKGCFGLRLPVCDL